MQQSDVLLWKWLWDDVIVIVGEDVRKSKKRGKVLYTILYKIRNRVPSRLIRACGMPEAAFLLIPPQKPTNQRTNQNACAGGDWLGYRGKVGTEDSIQA